MFEAKLIKNVQCVVYFKNAERGVVWEEAIILLPDNVHYVFLSATIPNARQFAEWICHLHKQVEPASFHCTYTINSIIFVIFVCSVLLLLCTKH